MDPAFAGSASDSSNQTPSGTGLSGSGPDYILDIPKGQPMSFDQADHGAPNPNYRTEKGFCTNCQSCVVCYEARLRGYDAETLANTPGSTLEQLSLNTSLAWIDPQTGKHPQYIFDASIENANDYYDFMSTTIEEGQRYTFQYLHKFSAVSGHIISVERTDNGSLRMYDPQTGASFVGKTEILGYLKSKVGFGSILCHENGSTYTVRRVPKLLRVDNMDFYLPVVTGIMKRRR